MIIKQSTFVCVGPYSVGTVWHRDAKRVMFKASIMGQQREEPLVFLAFERVQLTRNVRKAIGPFQKNVVLSLFCLFSLQGEQVTDRLPMELSRRKLHSPVL